MSMIYESSEHEPDERLASFFCTLDFVREMHFAGFLLINPIFQT